MSLSRLPLELILNIAHFLRCQRDLSSFMRTTRTFYSLVHPVLYRFDVRKRLGSALLFAASNGYTDLVKKLLAAGASIEACDRTDVYGEYEMKPDGTCTKAGNPILAAAHHGHLATLKTLLAETRPRQSCTNPQMRVVLHWAIRSHNIEIIDLMLARGAAIGLPKGEYIVFLKSNTALGVAITSGCPDEILERLLQRGAEVWEPENPCPWYEATVQREGHMLQLLLKHGRRPNSDRVLCELALRCDDTRALARITDPTTGGLDIRIHGHPALFTAVEMGHFEMAKYLVAHGANPHLHCSYQEWGGRYSTVWAAVQARHMGLLRFLVTEQGVRPDEQDIREAVRAEFEEAVTLLSSRGCQETPEKEYMTSYVTALKEKMNLKPSFHITTHAHLRCPTSKAAFLAQVRGNYPTWH
ncbi:ankyrin [Aspergillus steynii IBT 23096]|uniref:Ankyrin n=1 Tax=Aspergillus steynii IBT 23096 TaxID=1392250 RepID=A0A2I2GQL2_9EURO|nr:ankyrin [Aspergillus steynii IBT 23096]PLB55169.1 ankyrin [Aspergillus steynii IBT 23096]